jgi:Zn-dependent peptidase ImmA (M78 family)
MTMIPRPQRVYFTARRLLERVMITSPPVPVEKMAEHLGIEVRFVPFEGELSGILTAVPHGVIIGVNKSHTRARQRFTIAHEIGHYLLHQHDDIHIDRRFPARRRDEVSGQAIDPEEIAANAFAAELLMPAVFLNDDLEGRRIDYADEKQVEDLARRYEVSVQAMTFRLTNLGYLA